MVLLELLSGGESPFDYDSLMSGLKPGPTQNLGLRRFRRVIGAELQGLGLLGEVRVVAALVDLELGGHLASEPGLGEHPLDGLLYDGLGTAGEQLEEGFFAETTGEAGVAAIELAVCLESGEDDFLGIDDDDVVAHINVGGVERVGLAGEDGGGGGGEAAEGLAGGVDDKPLALDVFAARNRSRHF